MAKKKKLTFQKAISKISQAAKISYRSALRNYKGRSDDAKRIASLVYVKAGNKRFLRRKAISDFSEQTGTDLKRSAEFIDIVALPNKRRISLLIYADPDRPPKLVTNLITKREGKTFGRKIKRGKQKGKWIVWYDTVYNQVISEKSVRKLTKENQGIRIKNNLIETDFRELGRFKKFFTKRQKKKIKDNEYQITIAEAEQASEKIQAVLREEDLYEEYQQTFGESP